MSDDAIRRIDVEWVAIKAGIKPANRVTVDPERAGEVEVRAQREGFHVERGARVIEFPGRPASAILYISPDPERARELVAAEAPLLPPRGNRLPVAESVPLHVRLGGLLGFPRCCVQEFANRLRRGITTRSSGGDAHEDFVAAECASAASQRYLGRLNDLSADRRLRIITFYPCRYDCPTAAKYAAAVFKAAAALDHAAAIAIRASMLGEMKIDVTGGRGTDAAGNQESLTLQFDEY